MSLDKFLPHGPLLKSCFSTFCRKLLKGEESLETCDAITRVDYPTQLTLIFSWFFICICQLYFMTNIKVANMIHRIQQGNLLMKIVTIMTMVTFLTILIFCFLFVLRAPLNSCSWDEPACFHLTCPHPSPALAPIYSNGPVSVPLRAMSIGKTLLWEDEIGIQIFCLIC